jgi:predicted nucleic acid-binding protein
MEIILDTNILIEILKNNKKTIEEVEQYNIHLNENISNTAVDLVYEYSKSHSLDIPDSLIASTAINAKIPLLSYNKKDFKFIENLELK